MSGIYKAFVSDIATAIARQFQLDEESKAGSAAIQVVSESPPVERFVLDAEKMVFHFPDTPARLIEDVP